MQTSSENNLLFFLKEKIHLIPFRGQIPEIKPLRFPHFQVFKLWLSQCLFEFSPLAGYPTTLKVTCQVCIENNPVLSDAKPKYGNFVKHVCHVEWDQNDIILLQNTSSIYIYKALHLSVTFCLSPGDKHFFHTGEGGGQTFLTHRKEGGTNIFCLRRWWVWWCWWRDWCEQSEHFCERSEQALRRS